ncbi:PAS domain S-box protein [Niastella caeni]|uniref:histidine kinase n=1 Tax=Niastella caeni TaxID=2569763 RepID=A0A4S8HZD8_9BACT|nr:PAS domain S-box protein [Niastella caeni]THU39544.1 PAS domain S-box protein [Niastella caeni]
MPDQQTILFESEAGFQALFQYATVGILVIDREGYIQLANPCIEKIFGYNTPELIGKPVELLIPEALRKRHAQHIEGYFANPKARPMGYGLNLFARSKEGTEFPVEISLGHYEFYGEQLAVAFVTDITERKKAEDHAKESEKEYRFIFEGIHESFMLQQIIKDNNGNIIDLLFLEINPATEKIIQKHRNEIIGHCRSEFFGALDDTLIKIISRVEKGENVRYQQYIHSIGRWFDRSFYSLKTGQLITLSTDITQRKRDEEALRESQLILESEAAALSYLNECGTRLWQINDLQEGLDEMLTATIKLMNTDKGNIQLLNPEKQVLIIAAQKGFSQEFLAYFKEVSVNDDSACGRALKAKIQITIEDTETDPSFAPYREIARKSGFRAVQSTPLFGHDGLPIGMISTHFENTHRFTPQELNKLELYARKAESFIERYKMYEALEKKVKERTHELTEALEREKELSDLKSRFLSIASHEFRTPLSTILSSTSLIDKYNKEEQEENRKKHTARIKSSVKNLTDILDDFLSLDKLEQGKVKVTKNIINLHEFSTEIIEELNGILKAGQVINLSYNGDRNIEQDKKILRNVLLNLLSNAIKYSAEHKAIFLSVDIENNLVSMKVKDEGIGIPEEDQKNLFSKFYRAKNAIAIQGTGLGLNIVKRYVELLDGEITFISKQNEGSTFMISFPA